MRCISHSKVCNSIELELIKLGGSNGLKTVQHIGENRPSGVYIGEDRVCPGIYARVYIMAGLVRNE